MRSTSPTQTAKPVPVMGAGFVVPAADPRPTGIVALLLDEIRRLQDENRALRVEVDRQWLLAQPAPRRREIALQRLDRAAEIVDSPDVDDHLRAAYDLYIEALHEPHRLAA